MPEEPKRLTLSPAEVELMNEVLEGAPAALLQVAHRVGLGQVVTQAEVDDLVEVLGNAMLDDDYSDEEGLTARGIQIDEIIAVVCQMSEDFFR